MLQALWPNETLCRSAPWGSGPSLLALSAIHLLIAGRVLDAIHGFRPNAMLSACSAGQAVRHLIAHHARVTRHSEYGELTCSRQFVLIGQFQHLYIENDLIRCIQFVLPSEDNGLTLIYLD